jgi:UDP-N-acetylglucosamine--dolichyl-phosphate N-acetylglucosaminephosphotransferase
VPIFFMFACNFTNMLAGFNGLEIGTGAIASLGMAAVAYLNGSTVGAILSGAMFFALLAFLYYNRYPAKVFPGDVGTLIIGAALFTTMIISKIELFGAIILAPYIADAALKYLSVGVMTRESQTPTELKEGRLYTPDGSNLSLARIFIRSKALREPEVVFRVWAVEAACCAAAAGLAVRL